MDPLTRDLRDLDPSAPPSAVDLDRVITRGLRRRAATRFGVASGAGLAVLALATIAVGLRPAGPPAPLARQPCRPVPTIAAASAEPSVPSVPSLPSAGSTVAVTGSPAVDIAGPHPTGSGAQTIVVAPEQPGPPLTEPADHAIERLTTVLHTELARTFPGATIVSSGTCDESWRLLAKDHGYAADLEVYDAQGLQHLSIDIVSLNTAVACLQPGLCSGEARNVPLTSFAYGYGNGGQNAHVRAYVAENTMVLVDLSTYHVDTGTIIVTRPSFGASNDALTRLAATSGLTLYP
jgi:hypothetical protein